MEKRNYLETKIKFLFAELELELNKLNDIGMGEEGIYEDVVLPLQKLNPWYEKPAEQLDDSFSDEARQKAGHPLE